MDSETVSAYVDKFMKTHDIMNLLNLKQWDLEFKYEKCGNDSWRGQCDYDTAYHLACITIDPDCVESEQDVKEVLLHELMHLVVSEMAMSLEQLSLTFKEEDREYQMIQNMCHTGLERTVCSLEKIFTKLLK